MSHTARKLSFGNTPVRTATSENQSKFIQDRISHVEKSLGELCQLIGAYVRKTARIRDKGDAIALNLVSYVDFERYNQTTHAGLLQFADCVRAIQDYRQAEVDRLEARVLQPFSAFGSSVKAIKDDLKGTLSAFDREQSRKRALERVRERHPSDRHQISQAETELMRANVDTTRSAQALGEQLDHFERKKIHTIKEALLEFVNIEMIFHARALELHTKAYNALQIISEDDDVEEFHNSVNIGSLPDRLQTVHANSTGDSRGSLNRSSLNSTDSRKLQSILRKPSNSPGTKSKGSNEVASLDDTDDSDDDDDDKMLQEVKKR